ncbi:MAG: NAD-dependent epimerase/dehydratase family protein [Anaerolineae bacterium]|nr:NAD-dependent epimerase/dehydratase family protein [Anaerolineae bacterium]
MKILVLGGTGAIGKDLVHLLSANGLETFVTSRKKRQDEGLVRYIQGNAHHVEFLREILSDNQWDVVVDFMVYTTTSFKERIDLFLRATDQYVFISSARVYADSDKPITENTSRLLDVSEDQVFLSTDEYSLAKARQEDVLRNSGLCNWTIIRPYITYSENRLQLGVFEKEEWLYRALHGRTIIFSRDICTKKTTMTHGLDVARGIMAIIGNPQSFGETFTITTKESHTWDYILSIYLDVLEEHLGYRPKVLLQGLDQFLACRSVQYQVIYDRLFNRQFDTSKIAPFFDTGSVVKTDTGLRTCLEAFLDRPIFKTVNWKTEAIKDRQSNEFTPLKEIPGIKQKIRYLTYRYLVGK